MLKSPLTSVLKVTQVYDLLFWKRFYVVEPVVTNVLKFDILLPEIVLLIPTQIFLDILDALSISKNLD